MGWGLLLGGALPEEGSGGEDRRYLRLRKALEEVRQWGYGNKVDER